MISAAEFRDLAEACLDPFAQAVGLTRTDSTGEVVYEGAGRRLAIGMDRTQDYRVYAKVSRTVADATPVRDPTDPRRFNSYDLETLVARGDPPGESQDLGDFGAGTRRDVEAALAQVLAALERYARPMLVGPDGEWERLAKIYSDRVRQHLRARDIRER